MFHNLRKLLLTKVTDLECKITDHGNLLDLLRRPESDSAIRFLPARFAA